MKSKPKILCLTPDLSQCFFYRVWLPLKELQRRGDYQVKITLKIRESDLEQADIVYAQRPVYPEMISALEIAKHRGGTTVVVGNDDDLYNLPTNHPLASAYFRGGAFCKNLEKAYELADGLIVSTETLRDVLWKQIEKNKHEPYPIFVCPNAVDDGLYKAVCTEYPIPGRIIWAGSHSHEQDIGLISKSFQKIWRDHPKVTFVTIGWDSRISLLGGFASGRAFHVNGTFGIAAAKMKLDFLDKFPLFGSASVAWEYDGWESEAGTHLLMGTDRSEAGEQKMEIAPPLWDVDLYYDILQRTRAWVALAPLIPTGFNRSKSNVRLLDYAVCRIPTIASAFGPYMEQGLTFANCHAELGKRSPEWEKALIESLSPDFARDIYLADSRIALQNYTIQNIVSKWGEAFEEINQGRIKHELRKSANPTH